MKIKICILILGCLMMNCAVKSPNEKEIRTYVIFHHGTSDTIQADNYKRQLSVIRLYINNQIVYEVETDTLRSKVIK